ncbi:ANTAR domain-containing protein [Streptomyces sp. NPDC004237]|uniref:ANTAR domain-containing protein n=1 Tax=Streptomyces sp. NPDC004237 TaxID=3154455 RepID=UPI0033AC4CF0
MADRNEVWDVNTMACSQRTNSLCTEESALPTCAALQSEISALQQEIVQLQDSVLSQAVIDQAIGVILVLGGLRPHQGIEVLMAVSARTGLSVRVIAGQLVDCAVTERPPEGIRQALETAMADARSV